MKEFLSSMGITILIVGLITGGIITLENIPRPIEVETYIVGAEISHLDQNAYYQRNYDRKTDYIMSVRNDDFSTQFEITSEQYAQYRIDEVVEVEVTVWENSKGTKTWETYKLVKQLKFDR